jgi:hypothetical protein
MTQPDVRSTFSAVQLLPFIHIPRGEFSGRSRGLNLWPQLKGRPVRNASSDSQQDDDDDLDFDIPPLPTLTWNESTA